MKSAHHAILGAAASAVGITVLSGRYSLALLSVLWVYGVCLSVLIDLDHFLIARILVGDWSHLRRAVGNPLRALTDPEWVFPDLSMAFERLLSHMLLGGGLVLTTLFIGPEVAVFTGGLLYLHIVADLIHEIRHEDGA